MPRAVVHEFGWGGLNTRAGGTGLPLLDCADLQDMRVVGEDIVQRLGIVRIAQAAGLAQAIDLDGSSEYASAEVDARVWGLGLYWTLEIAVAAGAAGDDDSPLRVGTSTDAILVDIQSGKWRVQVTDSAATTTTLTSTSDVSTSDTDTLQVVRNGAFLTLRVNGTAEDSDTMSAANDVRTPVGEIRIGRGASSGLLQGAIDYVRLFDYAKTHHRDRLVRTPDPRAPYVLADYDGRIADGMIYDRSRYENHLVTTGSPSSVTSLCVNPAPIRAISMSVDENSRKQLLVAAGGQFYLATVA